MRTFLFFACALVPAFAVFSLVRNYGNTLQLYPEFVSEKTELGLGVNGAMSFTLTPVSLAGRALNLGAWHGHQKVRLKKEWNPGELLKLSFYPEGESELLLFFPGRVLRLSSRPGHPSAWIATHDTFHFTEKAPVAYTPPQRRWIPLEVLWDGKSLQASVDGVRLPPVPVVSPPSVSFGGYSSEGVLKIDDLSLGEHYRQSFSGHVDVIYIGLAVLFFLSLFLFLDSMGLALGVMACSLALHFVFERNSARYPKQLDLSGVPSHIASSGEILERLAALPSGPPVILWLGGSQAWGAGASREDRTAFSQLAARLPVPGHEWVNGAVSGAPARAQLDALAAVARKRKIAFVMLTTGVNDTFNPAYAEELRKVLREGKRLGSRVALLLEPVEAPLGPEVKAAQDTARAVASSENVPVIELQADMDAAADTAFLWWDFVHLTDAGAALEASLLQQPLAKFLGIEVKGSHELHQSTRPGKKPVPKAARP